MSDLRELYQEVILDHSRKPRNHHALPGANRHADGFNPLCGDKISLALRVEDGVVREVAFEGKGCAISTASSSMMTEALVGKSEGDVRALFEAFHRLVTGDSSGAVDPRLGKLGVFGGVREFPVRVKCATLAWHTLLAALDRTETPATTE